MNILIYGGEKLENQFFDGIFDGLDLEICELPELNLRDIKYKCSDDEVAEAIWQISGGHPKIIEQCIQYYFKYNDFKINECRESIMHLIPVIQLFTPFRKLSDDVKQQLCCLIKKDILPYYETDGISNSLIKQLYWKNFLKKPNDQKSLIWRSDILRELGCKILKCE